VGFRNVRRVIAALALAASSWPAALQPQPAPARRPLTFSARVEAVQVDQRSRYVPDLSQSDFAVFEDGTRQEIAFFAQGRLPLALSLLLDCSASMQQTLGLAQAAAVRFIRTLGPGDVAEVVQFNDRVRVLQDLTEDQAALQAAVEATTASGATVLYNALYVTLKELSRRSGPDVRRRRAIVLLSDGDDTASLVRDEDVLDLARRTQIALYAISVSGNRPPSPVRTEFNEARHFLTALARETGGQVFLPRSFSDLDGVYDRIAEELRSQYTLAYVSSRGERGGKWRRILVRTPQREGLLLRHRTGYYASHGG
jgi:Ca-activated chloride channel family protein